MSWNDHEPMPAHMRANPQPVKPDKIKKQIDYVNIGLNLQALRLQRRQTLADVSKHVDIDLKSIGHYENGRRIVIEKLKTLCDYYAVSIDDVISMQAQLIVNFV